MQYDLARSSNLQYDSWTGQRFGDEYRRRGLGAGDPGQNGFPVTGGVL